MNLSKSRITLAAGLWMALAGSLAQGRDINIEIWCPDISGDLQVDGEDVTILVAAWGQSCPTQPGSADDDCPEDVNGNGSIGRLDLARVLGSWGPCRCKGDLNGDGVRDQLDVDLMDQAIADDIGCGEDIDHDGTVSAMDLEIAQETWVESLDPDPAADVDRDEALEVTDMLAVLDAMLEGKDCRAEITGDGTVDLIDRLVLVHLANIDPDCP